MSRIIQLEDRLVVGSAESGHELLSSLVGQYISKAYGVTGESLNIAATSKDLGFHSLIPSTLSTGYAHEEDFQLQRWETIEPHFKGFSDKVIYVKRDLKDDIAIQASKIRQEGEEITIPKIDLLIRGAELCKERLDSLGGSYTKVSLEDLVQNPHAVLVSVLDKLRAIPELKISMEVVEEVVTASEVRGLRSDAESPYIEKVGAWVDVLTVEQAKYIDQKALELGL